MIFVTFCDVGLPALSIVGLRELKSEVLAVQQERLDFPCFTINWMRGLESCRSSSQRSQRELLFLVSTVIWMGTDRLPSTSALLWDRRKS